MPYSKVSSIYCRGTCTIRRSRTPQNPRGLPRVRVRELSAAESQAFVNQLLNPSEPNAALRNAAARYWGRVDRSQ